jgi:pilus assembly protein CpaC
MKYISKILALLLVIVSLGFSQAITIEKNSYKVVTYEQMIKSIKVSDSKVAEVSFIQTSTNPLKSLKILGKEFGNVTLLIEFDDNSMLSQDIDVVRNMKSIISTIEEKYPLVKITQSNDNIILEGTVGSIPDKDKIKDMFKKAGIDTDNKFIDMTTTTMTKKMVRLKLYIAEINNDKGMILKNNWSVGFRNFHVDDDNGVGVKYDYNDANSRQYASYMPEVVDAMGAIMGQSVSLTGGLASSANFLTNKFNVGLTLNYLASQGVATILTESTLLTTEEKAAKFLAGGELLIKKQTLNASGIPATEYDEKEYGIILDILASKIINDEYIDLTISTQSKQIDSNRANWVDNIPAFTNRRVETNVIAQNGSTIVLGGLVNNQDTKNIDKIPLLGDIPIIGHLFRSKDFQNGKSELVFFITPEIVEPSKNLEFNKLEDFKTKMETKNQELEDAGSFFPKRSSTKIESNPAEKKSNYDETVQKAFGL